MTGPGLGLIGAIFLKLFVDLAKFGATSLKSLLGINAAAQAQSALQQSVLQTLLQNENIQREILKLEGNKVAQEQLLLKIYNQQAAALARVQKAAATVTPGLFGKGFRGGEGGVGKRAAGGYIPAEARDVSRGVGGAHAGAKVVSIPNFAFGGGQKGTMVANTSEYYVPNYAGGGDAIFNQNMIKSMGMPKGARKIRAAGGYIPNFAKTPLAIKDPRFAMITPTVGGATTGIGKSKSGQSYQFPILGYDKSGLKLRNDKQITEDVRKFGVALATEEAMTLTGGDPAPGKVTKLGNAGSIRALAGTIFEAAVSALVKGPQYDMSQTSTFDFVGNNARNSLAKLYPGLSKSAQFIEAKIGFNSKIGTSMANKIEAYRGGPNTITRKAAQQLMGMRVGGRDAKAIQKEFGKISTRGAGGYIPNFADGLMGAIAREKSAGLPISQIRINQSGKLRNAQNPMGLAVTNTRDEPTGKIPNYAKPGGDIDSAIDGSIMKFFALQMAISSFTTVLGSAEEDANIFQKGLVALGDATMAAVNAMMVMQMIGINPLGKSKGAATAMGGLGRRMLGQPKIGPMGPGATRVVSLLANLGRFAGPIGLGITAIMGISSAAKMITGKGILEHLGFAAQGAADRLNEIPGAGGGGPKNRVESLGEKQNKLLVRKLELESKLQDAQEREAAFQNISGGRSSAEVLAEYGRAIAPTLEKPYDEMTLQEKIDKAFRDQFKKSQASRLQTLIDDPNFGAGKEVSDLTKQLSSLETTIDKNNYELSTLEVSSFAGERRFREETGMSLANMQISQARARNQAVLDLKPGASSTERLDNEFFIKQLDIQNDIAVKKRQQTIEMVKQFQIGKNLTDVEKGQLDTVIEMVNSGAKLEDIKDSQLALELSSKINLNDIYEQSALIADETKRELFVRTQILEVERECTKEQLARNTGLQGYINDNKKQMQDMQENFPEPWRSLLKTQ